MTALGNIAAAAEHVGQMKSGLCMSLVERDSHLELTMGVFEIVDPNERRPEHHMVFGRSPCGIDRPAISSRASSSAPSWLRIPANPQSARKLLRLIGEKLPIGLFGRVQGIFAGNRDC